MAACQYIELTKNENILYKGAGWAIVTVKDNQIIDFLYLADLPINMELKTYFQNFETKPGIEKYIGICGSNQFSTPKSH